MPAAGLADRLEVRTDPAARRANALPLLCQLLRRLVEDEDRRQPAESNVDVRRSD
jgi:hypothetical protein